MDAITRTAKTLTHEKDKEGNTQLQKPEEMKKTAEEILIEAIVEYNSHVNNMSKFSLDKEEINMFTNCMKLYAFQAIDEILSHERGDIVPEIEILKVRSNLK